MANYTGVEFYGLKQLHIGIKDLKLTDVYELGGRRPNLARSSLVIRD